MEIRNCDRIFFGSPAGIEFVALDPNHPAYGWYVQTYGGGIMIRDPQASGRTFIPADDIPTYEDLQFIARAPSLSC